MQISKRIINVSTKTRVMMAILAGIALFTFVYARFVKYYDLFYYPHPLWEYERKERIIQGMINDVDDSDFSRLPKPEPGDWLYHHQEFGQTFEEYKRINPVRPTKKRNRIVVQLLGEFSDREREIINLSSNFCEIYYNCPVKIEKPIKELDKKYSRQRSYGSFSWRQFRTDYFLYDILKPRIPTDAICYFGVTMEDLYPEESWNFVFGQASLKDRIGVYSLYRFFPGFFGGKKTSDWEQVALRRSCKVMSHEMGHIFSMQHCIYYKCCMNGSNSLEEMDARPIHLCPVCLKKIQWNTGFDIRKRYENLKDFYKTHKLMEEYAWVEKQLSKLK